MNSFFFSSYKVFGAVIALASTIQLTAADWPQFLGPDRNAISPETGLLDEWPDEGLSAKWKQTVGTGYSAPSIRDGRLVLHHRVDDRELVTCLNPIDGSKIWETGYPSSFVDPYGYNNGPRCSPILTEKYCYTFGAEGVLLCLDITDGSKIWEVKTQEKWNVPSAFFGVGSTPLLHGDRLFVMVGGQPNSGMVAFDAGTGSILWESVGRDNWEGQPMIGWPGNRSYEWKGYEKIASYSSPVLAEIHGQEVLIALMRQGIVGIDPASGKIHFSYWFRARVQESVNAINPVVHENRILISSSYYRQGSVLLEINPDLEVEREVWRGLSLEIHFTTPVLHQGHIYAFSGRNPPDASFRCVEWETGDVQWERDESFRSFRGDSSRLGRGSAILADGKLIALGETGVLALVEANPEKLNEISRFKVPDINMPAWTAPVLSKGLLYLRDEDTLLCLDLND